ncbi:metallophosphoesterase family protein [Natronosalvus amylolyticus]|uniref:metallophosphoesterase family protein n=1 Tax=Natronosalvus amylolyticus TaxID=2961994 RepID=UPI0020C97010|nr:metallophosphoesterase family protein [Natronosalvus amylolyticus]
MGTAIIADIHGNTVALDAVLRDLEDETIDRIVCLGDVAAGGPEPSEAVNRIRRLDCPVVMGNADEWVITPEAAEEPEESLEWFSDIGAWGGEQLSDSQLDFVKSFDSTIEVQLDDGLQLVCYHGSPQSTTDWVAPTTPQNELDEMFDDCEADILAGGHTHIQLFQQYRDAILLNPGSVGLSYGIERTTGRVYNRLEAEYALLTQSNGTLDVSLRRTPFDLDAVREMAHESEMPHTDRWLADWISGR